MTRVGSAGDGGYVIPAAVLDHTDCLLSFGLGMNCDFERDFQARAPRLAALDCYDHTVSRGDFYRMGWDATLRLARGSRLAKRLPAIRHALGYARLFDMSAVTGRARHVRLAIGAEDDAGTRSMTTALAEVTRGEKRHVFLKCDIEGAEYAIVGQIAAAASRLVGCAIEFHDIVADPARFFAALDRLGEAFTIVHVHPNNYGAVSYDGVPDVLEVSLVNTGMREVLRTAPPHDGTAEGGLDMPNGADVSDIAIAYV
jgi:hypothetical protein